MMVNIKDAVRHRAEHGSWTDTERRAAPFFQHCRQVLFDPKTAERTAKAAVPAGTTTDGAWAGPLVGEASAEFMALLRPRTLLGRLPVRTVPFNTRVGVQTGAGTYGWVGEASNKRVSALAFTRRSLRPYKVAGIIPFTDELSRSSDPAAETVIRDEMTAGTRRFVDAQFVDPALAGTASAPASITNGAPSQPSTGDPADDLRSLLAAMLADLGTLEGVWLVLGDAVAFAAATLLNASGSATFPSLGVNGGSVYGVPVLTTSAAQDLIIGVQAQSVAVALGDEVRLEMSTGASILMDDDPPDGPAQMTSLFQTNSRALRADLDANWEVARTGAVRYVSGADYGGGS